MRDIDMQAWSRFEHFKLFSTFDHPHFGMSANVDITRFYQYIKQNNQTLTVAILYLLSRVSNELPEFRYRIRDARVIEHEVVHPSFTILVHDDLFSFCNVKYSEDYSHFAKTTKLKMAYMQEHPSLEEENEDDDAIYLTVIPWVSFTGFMHPMQLHPADSIPRFAWGKFFSSGESLLMPLAVQGHHGVMDGLHIGRFYQLLQEYLNQPEDVLGTG